MAPPTDSVRSAAMCALRSVRTSVCVLLDRLSSASPVVCRPTVIPLSCPTIPFSTCRSAGSRFNGHFQERRKTLATLKRMRMADAVSLGPHREVHRLLRVCLSKVHSSPTRMHQGVNSFVGTGHIRLPAKARENRESAKSPNE